GSAAQPSASAIGVGPVLNSIVRRTVPSRPRDSAITAATSARGTSPLGTDDPGPSPTSMRPVGSSAVSRLGPSTVQSSPVERRCASAAAFDSAYGKKALSAGTPCPGPAPKYETIT